MAARMHFSVTRGRAAVLEYEILYIFVKKPVYICKGKYLFLHFQLHCLLHQFNWKRGRNVTRVTRRMWNYQMFVKVIFLFFCLFLFCLFVCLFYCCWCLFLMWREWGGGCEIIFSFSQSKALMVTLAVPRGWLNKNIFLLHWHCCW